eukprot:3717918-Lingulodinium_polyedra.AAC.1
MRPWLSIVGRRAIYTGTTRGQPWLAQPAVDKQCKHKKATEPVAAHITATIVKGRIVAPLAGITGRARFQNLSPPH